MRLSISKRQIKSYLPRDWAKIVEARQFLWMQRTSGFDVPSQPHFDALASRYFLEQIQKSRVYLEYGAGGSTVVAAQHVDTLVSVDSDQYFLRSVKRKLSPSRDNQAIQLIHANIGFTRHWGKPVLEKLTLRRTARWANYSRAPWDYLHYHQLEPDLILVDGRFRVACVLECVTHISNPDRCKIAVDDYGDRPQYRVIEKFCDKLEMHGQMAIFRPKADFDPTLLQKELQKARYDWR